MENYADYNFYQNDYKGSLSETLFNRFITEASVEIRNYINTEIADEVIEELTDEEYFRFQYAVCSLCDFLNKNGTVASKGSANSISIDGVSISGGTSGDSYESSKAKILDSLPQKLTRYL